GRIACPLRAVEPGSSLRPRGSARLPARRAGGHLRALRAGRRARGRPRRAGGREARPRAHTVIARDRYAALYGPTAGDQIRLADTDLWIEVERDDCVGGEEAVFGGGKTIRESMHQGSTTRA